MDTLATTEPTSGTRAFEKTARVPVAPERLFEALDDPRRLGAHMSRRSWRMGGGRMTYEFDAAEGRALGSHIRMSGWAFGLPLGLEEVVTVRDPPWRKRWRTVGEPRLLVVGGYELGFEISADSGASNLRVLIKYWPFREKGYLGRLSSRLADRYARWCVGRVLEEARRLGAG